MVELQSHVSDEVKILYAASIQMINDMESAVSLEDTVLSSIHAHKILRRTLCLEFGTEQDFQVGALYRARITFAIFMFLRQHFLNVWNVLFAREMKDAMKDFHYAATALLGNEKRYPFLLCDDVGESVFISNSEFLERYRQRLHSSPDDKNVLIDFSVLVEFIGVSSAAATALWNFNRITASFDSQNMNGKANYRNI